MRIISLVPNGTEILFAVGAGDQVVSAQVGSGESLYTLDEQRIAELAPDLIVTQQLCPVCAVSTEQVDGAIQPLARCPEVLSLDPKTFADVMADIRRVGEVTGRSAEGEALVRDLERRLDAVRARVQGRPRPRVVALEWLDPPFMPCGYDEAGAAAQFALLDRPDVRGRMFPVDANGCFSRPGPRLVDGIERLAELFHG